MIHHIGRGREENCYDNHADERHDKTAAGAS